jgi:hypothetical protein
MSMIAKILSGTAILIGLYLFLTNGKETAGIISAIGNTYTGAVKTLQGNG